MKSEIDIVEETIIKLQKLDIERDCFEHWIKENWNNQYHNFSIKKDGDYFYWEMEDAWNIWLGAINNERNKK